MAPATKRGAFPRSTVSTGYYATACGGSPAQRARGNAFSHPPGGCPVFAAKGGIKNGARKGAHLASAAILYTSRGRSTQPVREASAGPGQNPWRPGPSGPAEPSTLARRASTFGNTGKHRPGPGPGPDPDRAEGAVNLQARKGLSFPAPFTQMAMKHKAPPRRKRRVTGFP